VVRVTDTYGRIIEFLYRSRYFFFQAAPRVYPRGFVDPVPDPLLLRKFGSAGNRNRASGSDHQTTEAVKLNIKTKSAPQKLKKKMVVTLLIMKIKC
jgi:hypothetical protein